MSRELDHFTGSTREARRESYLAGAEAIMDLTLRVLQRHAQYMQRSNHLGQVGPAISALLMNISGEITKDAMNVFSNTPHDREVEARPTAARSGRRATKGTGNTTTSDLDDE